MKNKKLQPLIYSLLIVIGVLLGNQFNLTTNQENNYTKIYGVLDLIESHYVDTINKKKFENKTIDAILENLDTLNFYLGKY